MNKIIYVDNSATTKVSSTVLDTMLPYLQEQYGNPSTIYEIGSQAKRAITLARENIAKYMRCLPNEIFFTSGGTESDNWAIKGTAFRKLKEGKNHIISSKIEHHAVLHTLEYLSKHGFDVTYLDVDEFGLVSPEDVERAITDKTALVTIMYANNEIGTIQPIKEIGAICKEHKILFHTDAVQAIGHADINLQSENIDLLSLSGHKIYGPKGVGILYIRKGVQIDNLFHGGAQESNKRAGTENVAGIMGLSKAIEEAYINISENNDRISKLRDKIITNLLKISRTRLNGDRVKRLPGNVNICFEGVEGESILLMLNNKGICASSGSACTSGSLDPSHVLLALGLPHEIAHGSLRISLGKYNTEEEVDYIIKEIPPIIQRLRDMSPLWDKIILSDKNNNEVKN